MSFFTENLQLTPPKGARNGQTLVPFSFQADGAGGTDLTRFRYAFADSLVSGDVVTITFDWEVPPDVTVLARPTDLVAPDVTVSGNDITVDFSGATAGDSYDILLGFSRDAKLELSTDLATGNAKYEDFVSPCFAATGEERSLGSVIGEFEIFGGGLAELTYSRGFRIEDQGSGVYRVIVGKYSDTRCSAVVTSSDGIPAVTYNGDAGYFEIDLGGAPTNAAITFIFSTVL